MWRPKFRIYCKQGGARLGFLLLPRFLASFPKVGPRVISFARLCRLSMSSGSDVTWLSILEDKLKELHVLIEQGYQIPKGPLERGTFRERFEHLCRQQKVKDRVQLEYSYLDTYQHVIDIAAGVTKTSPSLRDCTLDQTLESLVWRVALSTLQVSIASWTASARPDLLIAWMRTWGKRVNACQPVD